MKQTMNEFDFKNEFKKIRPDNFEEIISLAMKSYINYKQLFLILLAKSKYILEIS